MCRGGYFRGSTSHLAQAKQVLVAMVLPDAWVCAGFSVICADIMVVTMFISSIIFSSVPSLQTCFPLPSIGSEIKQRSTSGPFLRVASRLLPPLALLRGAMVGFGSYLKVLKRTV